ncbi:hypothetical protein D3C84_142710 [compost metagenome]
MLHVRQADVLDGGAEFLQLLDHRQHLLADAGIEAAAEVFPGQADTQAVQRLAKRRQIVIDRLLDAGGVLGVETGHGLQHQRAILGGARQGAALIEAGGVGDHAPARYPSIGRFDSGEVGQRRRLADRAAGVGAGSGRQQTCGDRRGRAARGAARYAGQVPGVVHRAVVAGLVGRAHGELVHVQLAQGHGAGGGEFLHHGGVVGRLETGEDLRAAAGQHIFGAEQVLVADRCTEQGAGFAGGAARIGGLGLAEGQLCGDADEAVELRVESFDARQQLAGQFLGGELFGGQGAGDFSQGQSMHHSITLGTRYRPFSTAGAIAW